MSTHDEDAIGERPQNLVSSKTTVSNLQKGQGV